MSEGHNMTDKKIKILTLSDHPLLPSGVGTQTKYIIEALLNTKKFQVISFGGAVKHDNYNVTKTHEYGDDWIIFPVDGYGTPEQLRSALHIHKPDILYFMTDPRFFTWLWEIEDEVRSLVPMVYYHVWDNRPYPTFNSIYYNSTDKIVTISKVTSDIVKNVSPGVEEEYLPHAVNADVFKPLDKSITDQVRKQNNMSDKFTAVWVNRNARRKQSGTLLFWWKQFLDRVGHDKATLIMHTDIRDPHGQPLDVLANHLGLNTQGQVQFSTHKTSPQHMAQLYNLADVAINISDAEGFGLGTLEALSCGTPIVVNMTGGLQEQVTDGENCFGVGIEPASKAIIGSLQVPWIYEDRLNENDFVDALEKMYNMTPEERTKLGEMGRQHVLKNYNFENFQKRWVEIMLDIHERHGSWDDRKVYKKWELKTI